MFFEANKPPLNDGQAFLDVLGLHAKGGNLGSDAGNLFCLLLNFIKIGAKFRGGVSA